MRAPLHPIGCPSATAPCAATQTPQNSCRHIVVLTQRDPRAGVDVVAHPKDVDSLRVEPEQLIVREGHNGEGLIDLKIVNLRRHRSRQNETTPGRIAACDVADDRGAPGRWTALPARAPWGSRALARW